MQVVERDAAVEELMAAAVARWAARVSLLENIACGGDNILPTRQIGVVEE